MIEPQWTKRDELERIRRVADQLCTGHAALRDRYRAISLAMDVVILLSSLWLTAVAFIDPRLSRWLTPADLDPVLWIGLLGVLTFALTLVQLRADWKSRGEAHRRSAETASPAPL